MMNRRSFLKIAAGAAAFGVGARAAEDERLRTISYNVLAFRGFPNTAATRKTIRLNLSRHPEMTAKALAAFSPDIVTLQECPPEEDVRRFAKALGMRYAFFPGGWKGNSTYPGGFPGAIVTRFEIDEAKNRPSAGAPHDDALFTRHLGCARLATPFGTLHVVSAHLHASEHPTRMNEAAAIVELIGKLRENGPVLLQGDLNSKPKDPEYAVWVEGGLVDVGKAMGIGDKPTSTSLRPRQRIDYIWATPQLAKTARRAAVLENPPFVPKPRDRSAYALSDHLPVMAEFLTGAKANSGTGPEFLR